VSTTLEQPPGERQRSVGGASGLGPAGSRHPGPAPRRGIEAREPSSESFGDSTTAPGTAAPSTEASGPTHHATHAELLDPLGELIAHEVEAQQLGW
jgi:hypothetical protein